MIDRDLAILYGVSTKNLNKAVRRNKDRFPSDFMFQLNVQERDSLRFQFGTLKRGQHAKYPPSVFTQQGVAMLSSVLKSKRASKVNIEIMRAFVKLRELLLSDREMAKKLDVLEKKVISHDMDIRSLFSVLRKLMNKRKAHSPKRQIVLKIN